MTEYTIPRDTRRVPLATRVQLKFEWFSGFISEYSANLSPGGMFIRTQTPEPVGRELGFEFRLGDGFELIQGTGEVMWVRPLDESPEKPAGMGIRFLELSPHSRELIGRMVETYVREGGTPFDVGRAPAAPTAPAVPPAPAIPAAPPLRAAPPARPPSPAVPPASPSSPAVPPATAVSELALPPAACPEVRPPRPEPTVSRPPPARPPERPPSPAEPSPWPGLLVAGAAAPPAKAIEPSPAIEPEIVDEARPVRVSRIVLWTLFAAFLGLIAWMALSQDFFLGLLSGRGAVAAATRPETSHRAAPRLAARPAEAPGASPSTAVAAAPAPPGAGPVASSPAPPAAPTAAPATVATAPAPPSSAPNLPLTAIEKITWQQNLDGTEVVVWGNGTFRRQDYGHYRIDGDPPRELIKLRGIDRPFGAGRLIVGTRQVRQVRTGLHSEGDRSELHVVLDLTGFGVEVTGIREDAERLRIFIKGK